MSTLLKFTNGYILFWIIDEFHFFSTDNGNFFIIISKRYVTILSIQEVHYQRCPLLIPKPLVIYIYFQLQKIL